jgi:hypothetical protein
VKTKVPILVVEVLTSVEVDVNGVNTVKADVIRGVVVVTLVVVVDVLVVCVVETDIDVVVVVACWTARVMEVVWMLVPPPLPDFAWTVI